TCMSTRSLSLRLHVRLRQPATDDKALLPRGFARWGGHDAYKAAAVLGVAPRTLRLAANRGEIDAVQPLADGPWLFRRSDLDGPAGKAVTLRTRTAVAVPHPAQETLFPSTT